MNRVQNIRNEIWKNKAVRKYKISPGKVVLAVFASTFLKQVSIKLY